MDFHDDCFCRKVKKVKCIHCRIREELEAFRCPTCEKINMSRYATFCSYCGIISCKCRSTFLCPFEHCYIPMCKKCYEENNKMCKNHKNIWNKINKKRNK